MTATECKVIKAKLGLLELARQLSSVTQACRVMGYSRDSFSRFRDLYGKGGDLTLAEISRGKPNLKNHVVPQREAAVVALAITEPVWAGRGDDGDEEVGVAVAPVRQLQGPFFTQTACPWGSAFGCTGRAFCREKSDPPEPLAQAGRMVTLC
jgi:hypothetical protein